MGIKGLTALISEHAPRAMSEHDIKTMFGRKVAIDASMSLYQFLIAVRQKDGEMLMNENGEVTSHLMGTFYRTIRMVDHGIKPCYVFDGKPPEMKSGVLKKRFEKREEAKEGEAEAKETGTAEEVAQLNRRQVRVSREQNEECQKLLKLMGIPVVIAPGEAEAQCAELARGGKVFGAGSEDMDTLTFNSPVLLRHLTFSEAKKAPISEIHLDKVLEGLDMKMDQFIDLCILMGCDYVEPLKGVGPSTALKLIKEHGSLRAVVKFIRDQKALRDAEEAEESVVEEEPEEDSIKEKEHITDDEEKRVISTSRRTKNNRIESDEEGEESSSPVKDGKKNSSQVRISSESDSEPDYQFKQEDEGEEELSAAEFEKDTNGPAKDEMKTKKSSVKKKPAEKKGTGAKPKPKSKSTGKGKVIIPDDWPWEEAKALFLKPDVTRAEDVEVEWSAPDVEGLVDFLVRDKGFNEERVRNGASKLQKNLNAKQQGRLDGFFKVVSKADDKKGSVGAGKRKADTKAESGAKKPKTSAKKK
ncbi:pin domain-like protein [Phaffia rhodozyma]|uniref:Flap endonuclease 1 n=1 Tax=Phaffia rhodozyma TaxID=264483 RepID=A0A0F7SHS4_PHARH|nr:pin domain-like protein [Phaffia rhodozyma]